MIKTIRGWARKWRVVFGMALLEFLQACSFIEHEERVKELNSYAQQLMKNQELTAGQSSSLIRSKKPRIAGEMVYLKTAQLPEALLEPITFVTRGNESLISILEDLSKLTGVPIKTSELGQSWGLGAPSNRTQGAGLASSGGSNYAGASASSGLSGMVSMTGMTGASEVNAQNLNFEHRGSVRSLLDMLATQANVSWRFNMQTQSVEFFRFETRTYSVFLPPGVKSVSAGISLSGVSGASNAGAASGSTSSSLQAPQSGSGAGNVAVSQVLSINPWGSIMEGVRAILSEGNSTNGIHVLSGNGSGLNAGLNGSAVNSSSNGVYSATLGGAIGAQGLSANMPSASAIANPELGMITVTAKPLSLERVQRYIASINERFAHNVMIDVKIFSVALDEQNSLGFGLNMVYSRLGQMGATISTPSPLQAGVDTPGILTLTPPSGSKNWSGSTLVAQALSQWGKVALQRQGQVLAINGQPSPIQVANEISFVASSSTTTSANVGNTITQNTGSKVVGFTANFLPLILGDNRILLSYQMQISSLATPLTPNAQGIQTPNIASQSMQQQAFVQDGQAIVLFGYDEQRAGVDSANTIAGYSKSNSQSRQMMVIVLQVNTGGVVHEP